MSIASELKVAASWWTARLFAIAALLSFPQHPANAADPFQSSCRSTCGNGTACTRAAKQALSRCVESALDPAACLANYSAARDACKAGVGVCRNHCPRCAASVEDALSSCQSAADPLGCVERVVPQFYACSSGAAESCPTTGGLATPAAIAQSPFANREAETLAIEASGAVVAPQQVYDRIVRDLDAIRASNPVDGIRTTASWVPDELLIGFDDAGKAAVAAGAYTDWNCSNALYGMTSIDVRSAFVLVHYGHLFNMPLLAATYATLPHITYAEPNGLYGDGDDVCASSDGETYSYVFDAGSGDCAAGCIEHTYWGFSTSETGEITSLGTWSSVSGNPPRWFMGLSACTRWL
jgi:hypothetical protein